MPNRHDPLWYDTETEENARPGVAGRVLRVLAVVALIVGTYALLRP